MKTLWLIVVFVALKPRCEVPKELGEGLVIRANPPRFELRVDDEESLTPIAAFSGKFYPPYSAAFVGSSMPKVYDKENCYDIFVSSTPLVFSPLVNPEVAP